MTTHAIEVQEYSELDFEHVTLQGSDYQYCSECGASHEPNNQLWLCQYCGYLNVEES